jgi:hypothetical protein
MSANGVESLLEVGNSLIETFNAAVSVDFQQPNSPESAAAIATLVQTSTTLVNALATNSPFSQLVSSVVGGQAGLLALTIAGSEFQEALVAYQNNPNTANSDAVLISATGVAAAGGGLLSIMPIPQVRLAGLAIQLAAIGAQNALNGNLTNLGELLGNEIYELFNPSENGGDLTIRQYSTGSSEYLTFELFSTSGVGYGEVGVLSGEAADVWVPQVTVNYIIEGADGSHTVYDSSTSGGYWVSSANAQPTEINSTTFSLSDDGFLDVYWSLFDSVSFSGNTSDFAQSVTNSAGITGNYLAPDSLLDVYSHVNDWFSTGYGSQDWLDPTPGDSVINNYLYGSPMTGWEEAFTLDYSGAFEVLQYLLGETNDIALTNDIESKAQDFYANGSPIAIDLDGDGIKTISIGLSHVNFDITGDGVAERTGWLSPNDAFLVIDSNGNKKIDGVNEMFGGLNRGEGFAELASLDGNGDGVINKGDEAFSSLRLWQDQNSNGITDKGEILKLKSQDISELSLDYAVSDRMDNGNLLGEVSNAMTKNGEKFEMVDVYFRYHELPIFQDEDRVKENDRSERVALQHGRSSRPNSFSSHSAEGGLNSQLENLVSAMSSFAPPAAGQTILPHNHQDAPAGVIAANWQ